MKRTKQKRTRMLLVVFVFSLLLSGIVKQAEAEAPINARNFQLNGAYSDDIWLTKENEEHWYRVDVPSDGLLELRIMSYCSGSLNYSLWNEDLSNRYKFTSCGDYISGAKGDSPNTGAVTKSLSKGTYYFCLSGTTGKYKLMGNFTSYDANDAGADSYDSPMNYTLDSTVTGALTETDKEDWYRITVPANGEYKIKFMSYCTGNNSLNYQLYNYDLSTKYMDSYVSKSNSAAPNGGEKTAVLAQGTYYLKVWNTTGKYTMTFSNYIPETTTTETNNLNNYKEVTNNLSLKVKAKKGKKKITVTTTPYASVTVKYGNKKWSNQSSGSKGKLTISVGKKLKKGKKVTVTVKKTGYYTKKMTVKVK